MRFVVLLATFAAVLPAADQPKDMSAQAKRGMELFRNSAKGACAACHQLEGFGTAVGPDLSKTAGALPPRALAMAIRATMTVYVQEVKPKGASAYPGIKTEDGSYFDLSKTPPEQHKYGKGEVELAPNTKWKHPPQAQGYSNEQLADIIAYLRFVGAGDKREVDPDILQ